MRTMIGYSIWCKRDMLAWLLSGVVENFEPANTEFAIHFDSCDDGSQESYNRMRDFWLVNRGFKDHVLSSDVETREVGGHNALLKLFMASQCDTLIVAQDDQRFESPYACHIEKLSLEIPNLGVIGGRDGYEAGYGQFTGSRWSESAGIEKIGVGEVRERSYLNSGPITYNRNLVEKVGFLDEEFCSFYIWDDYGARAKKAGLRNFVVGSDITHAKFGHMKNTWWYDGNQSAKDSARLRMKHGLG